ncbi:MAG: hypothetical protein MUC93_01370 [Bacteroidales bacterium]|jgi:hypothetical protein|nr:hypothetical protein [Bacteroidales bacterium]
MKNLKEIKDRNPFKVPDNYFEEVNRKIISSTDRYETFVLKKGLSHRMRPLLSVAAAVAVLILLGYATIKIFFPSENYKQVPEISMQEFSDSYLNDIDVLTLEEYIDPMAFYDKVPDVSNSEIIDYLMLEDVGLNEISELL